MGAAARQILTTYGQPVFIVRGLTFFLAASVGYIAGVFGLISILPRRVALVVLLAFVLGHYLGACTWMMWRFRSATDWRWPSRWSGMVTPEPPLGVPGGSA